MNKDESNQILEEGEGQFIEFKESFSKYIAKDIVAFANASGGWILLGVDDENVVKGIKITNSLKSQIVDVGKNCDPKILVDLEEYKNVLIVKVREGEDKPYQCSSGFYLRLGYNSQKLTRDEILRFSIQENKIRFDEQICKNFDFDDFDDEKFDYYLKLASISKTLSTKDILRSLNVLTDKGMTNAGILFFAKKPYKYIMSSRIRCVLFKGNDRVNIIDKKEVDKGIIGNIEFAVNYLDEHVPVRFEIKGLYRKEYPQFPQDAYREAIVNAMIHRDFFETGEVAVEKLQDFIYVNNPGGVVSALKKEDFGKMSFPRNRLLADLLSRTYLMERVGTGIRRIQEACKKNDNLVELRDEVSYFFVTFDAVKQHDSFWEHGEKVGRKLGEKLGENEEKILKIILNNKFVTISELSKSLDISTTAIEKNIAKLKDKG
ncbi:MAG: putative DNA binding domain-containing protein, partial [Candidatus Thermoplasmatota archaeon]|nr:putative DNA binding domain-containing protein [Candidatus Thermoplasmatota archaeon]